MPTSKMYGNPSRLIKKKTIQKSLSVAFLVKLFVNKISKKAFRFYFYLDKTKPKNLFPFGRFDSIEVRLTHLKGRCSKNNKETQKHKE